MEQVELYLKVVFWIGIVGNIIRMFQIGTCKYPRVEKKTLGGDIILLFVHVGFLGWVIYLRHFVIA